MNLAIKNKKRIISFTIILACFISLCPIYAVKAVNDTEILSRMKLITENSYLQLYFDELLTDVAVRVKKTGDVWFSNPVAGEEDVLASDYYKQLMKSQLSVRYFNESVQSSEMDNYSNSILEEQFEITYLNDGLTITYTIGEMADKVILPRVISEIRFLQYLEKMDSAVQKKVLRNYTLLNLETMKEADKKTNLETYKMLKENNIYILKSGTKDYMQKELMEYFVESGYTKEDMESDSEENGFLSESNKPWFIIPLTYQLDGENLLVTVDSNGITYNEDGYYLVNIDILKYFGAAGKDKYGYLFVPDGSGTLIYLNNGKINVPSYSSQVYGTDKTNTAISTMKPDIDEKLSIKMPVYGLKSYDKAWFAIIESGDAYANINADISGRINSYNNVYAGFSYLKYGAISMGDMIGNNNSFQMYSKPEFIGVYQIRYAFLQGEKADYSGMAEYYREYLVSNGVLTKGEVKQELPFYVEFIGAIDKLKSVLGIKYKSTETLTSFKQAKEIISQLSNNGISNIKVQYSGWLNEGLEASAPVKADVVTKLEKGGTTLKKFISSMAELGIPVYTTVDLQYVYKDGIFDGYTAMSYAPRYFDKSIVKTGRYLIPNGFLYKKDINLISPYYVKTVTDKFLKETKKYSLTGTALGSLSYDLFSDYMSNRYTDRQKAVYYNTQAMEAIENTHVNGILANNANVYTFSYTNDILEVPVTSNNLRLTDEDIPFYAMVIRGYIEYAGEPLNLSGDYTTTLLKSVESGSGLYFKWIYEDNSKVKNTEYDYLYSVNYKTWLKNAVDDYNRLNQVFSSLQGQYIRKHEKVQENVYLVTYELGTKVIINYNEYVVAYNGTKVSAKDFAVVK